MSASVASPTIPAQIHKIVHGSVLMTVYLPKRRVNLCTLRQVQNTVGLVTCTFSVTLISTSLYLFLVWCWGWDGAGDLEGPDVDPIWERMPNKSTKPESIIVKHDRSMGIP